VGLRSLFLWDVAPDLDISTFKAETAMLSGNAGTSQTVKWCKIQEEFTQLFKLVYYEI
jgi:hypothetical protein